MARAELATAAECPRCQAARRPAYPPRLPGCAATLQVDQPDCALAGEPWAQTPNAVLGSLGLPHCAGVIDIC
jgi:hypothetical protein